MSRRNLTLLKIVAPVAVVAAAAMGALALAGMRPEPETRVVEAAVPLVRVHTVVLEDLRLTVESQGTVQPRTEGRVVPEVNGRVVWVSPNFVDGGFFETDQALLRLDSHDYEQGVVRARAEVAAARLRQAQEQAEADLARKEWEQLGEGEAPELTLRVPQLENAAAALAAAEANLVRAERDLARTEIRAPYAGRVRQKSVDVGQFVTAGAPLGTIYAIDAAEIRLPLPDEDLAYLDLPMAYRGESGRRGPAVTVLADFAGRTHQWEGRIVRTEGQIDPASRMVHVVAEVRNPYGRGADPDRPPLSVGMYVRARIEGILAPQVAVLPRAAWRADGRVLVLDGSDRIRFAELEILRATREQVVVSSGLRSGDRVVLSALDAVIDGMQVRVAPDVAPPDGAPLPDGPAAAGAGSEAGR